MNNDPMTRKTLATLKAAISTLEALQEDTTYNPMAFCLPEVLSALRGAYYDALTECETYAEWAAE